SASFSAATRPRRTAGPRFAPTDSDFAASYSARFCRPLLRRGLESPTSLHFPNFSLVLVVIDLSLATRRRRRAPAADERSGNRRVSKALPRSAEKAGNGLRNSHFDVVAENAKKSSTT